LDFGSRERLDQTSIRENHAYHATCVATGRILCYALRCGLTRQLHRCGCSMKFVTGRDSYIDNANEASRYPSQSSLLCGLRRNTDSDRQAEYALRRLRSSVRPSVRLTLTSSNISDPQFGCSSEIVLCVIGRDDRCSILISWSMFRTFRLHRSHTLSLRLGQLSLASPRVA